MASLTRYQQDARYQQVPDLVQNIARDNAAIADVIHRFVGGNIATREEMLIQCIVQLNINWDAMLKSYIDFKTITGIPTPMTASNPPPRF
jgi:hypothetical protein